VFGCEGNRREIVFFFLITSITSPFIGSVSGGFHFCGVPNDESFYLESVPFLFSFYPI
jgi:hypothetical protein